MFLGHFQFAKYVDSLLQSRIVALHGRVPDRVPGITDEKLRNLIISKDKACIRYIVLAVRHYAEALVLDVKHVYQALPRLLSLWFDFTSIPSQRFTTLHSLEKENSELDCKFAIDKYARRESENIVHLHIIQPISSFLKRQQRRNQRFYGKHLPQNFRSVSLHSYSTTNFSNYPR